MFAIPYVSCVTCQMSHITRHMSYVMCHVSHVMCHMSTKKNQPDSINVLGFDQISYNFKSEVQDVFKIT